MSLETEFLCLLMFQDLVKGHLMFAVREEVEVLKDQLKALWERNSELQRENALLKSLAGLSAPYSPQQVQQVQLVQLAEWIQAVEWTQWVQRAALTPQNNNSAVLVHPSMTSV